MNIIQIDVHLKYIFKTYFLQKTLVSNLAWTTEVKNLLKISNRNDIWIEQYMFFEIPLQLTFFRK